MEDQPRCQVGQEVVRGVVQGAEPPGMKTAAIPNRPRDRRGQGTGRTDGQGQPEVGHDLHGELDLGTGERVDPVGGKKARGHGSHQDRDRVGRHPHREKGRRHGDRRDRGHISDEGRAEVHRPQSLFRRKDIEPTPDRSPRRAKRFPGRSRSGDRRGHLRMVGSANACHRCGRRLVTPRLR
jgi:hypothetical protein